MNLFKRAAQLRRKNKRLTVQQSVKLAAKELKPKRRVGATKIIERGEKKDAPVKRIYRQIRDGGRFAGTKKVAGMPIIASVGAILTTATKHTIEKIGQLEAKKFAARTKREKSVIAKQIAEQKALFRRLKKR